MRVAPGNPCVDEPSSMAACSYCGLPTRVPVPHQSDRDRSNVFCCLGCRIAAGIVRADDHEHGSLLTRLGLAIFFSMNVMVFTLVLWTWNVHDVSENALVVAFRGILRYACLLFSAPVLILLGVPLAEAAAEAIRRRRLTTDVLLLLGVGAAFGYSVLSLLLGLPDIYFEVACMILVAVTLGKWLEATAKRKATQAVRTLQHLLPDTVRRVDGDGEEIVALDAVLPGDELRVLDGERIPIDGTIHSATAVIDEQVITGESLPKTKVRGDSVYAGTLNLAAQVHVRADTSVAEGTIARLVQAVEASTASRCSAVRLADRLAAWFVPLIVIMATLAAVLNWPAGSQNALLSSISVVLIACPCALGIATPLALWVATHAAGQRGVLFRDGDALLTLANGRSIAFDKTGTITVGTTALQRTLVGDAPPEVLRQVTNTLTRGSSHVLSQAIARGLFTSPTAVDRLALSDVHHHIGRGVTATVTLPDGRCATAFVGSDRFADELGMAMPRRLARQLPRGDDQCVVYVGWDAQVRGVYLLGEQLRPEASRVFDDLKTLGLSLTILTGDRAARAAAMECRVGVRTIGELLPDDKATEVRALPRPTVMIGDGMNDALALAAADVGVALDCGADISRDTAEVCLLGSTLENLPWAIRLARATHKAIRRNLVWAVGYNGVGILFAVSGRLNPIIAALAMVGSSLFVLTNSLALAHQFTCVPDPGDAEAGNTAEAHLAGRTAVRELSEQLGDPEHLLT